MKFFVIFLTLFVSLSAHSKTLDKILAVVDDEIITLSEAQRLQENLDARRTISPIVYSQPKYTLQEIAEMIVKKHVIRANLNEVGYVISDDQVELQIKDTEKNLGVNRDHLLKFLASNNLTFDEYFEIIRETMEFQVFHQKVIQPLVSITEQDIKNHYYRQNVSNQSLAFRYTLVDFSLPIKSVTKEMLKDFQSVMTRFQNDGILHNNFKNVNTGSFDDITEEGLDPALKKLLKSTDEGSFSTPIKLENEYHVFFVKKKNLVESDQFTKAKENLKAKLFQEQSENMIVLWFKRTQNKHYIKFFF